MGIAYCCFFFYYRCYPTFLVDVFILSWRLYRSQHMDVSSSASTKVSCKPNIYVSWSTSELRRRLVPLNWFKPSSKIFYWSFQGGTSFVDLLCFCSVLCLLCLCTPLFICALWSPAGKGLTSWLSFVVSAVSLSLSHWYPGSGVVLDCIDSWSLHPYLLWK